ncbi:MAG: deoxyhypusine synthase [Candidatus Altiarchaeales archaeon ex4484_2]|nr:MAG: deoxyhypusine synthase [Candidatus Altiarchaeales archaeon ex4484_2]
MEEVEDIDSNLTEVDDIIKEMKASGGFTAKKFSVGVDILEKMCGDEECLRFLSFPACVMATGLRGVLRDLVKEKLFDVVVTTTGSLDHDLARLWKNYYHGSFELDDRELHRKQINRLGNILIPNESYGIVLEDRLQPMFGEIFRERKEISGHELVWKLGECLEKEENRENSLTYWAYKNDIPVFIPGFFDGAVGSQLWFYWQTRRDLKINLFLDEQKLSDLVFGSEKAGAFMVGGGISKHHTIWWNQFRDGLDYSVYVTTAAEFDGSLSGARMREAISWGKLKGDARFVTIDSDATVALPFMVAALKKRLKGR